MHLPITDQWMFVCETIFGVLEIVGPNKDVARKICAVAFNLVIFLDAFKTVINLFWEGFIS